MLAQDPNQIEEFLMTPYIREADLIHISASGYPYLYQLNFVFKDSLETLDLSDRFERKKQLREGGSNILRDSFLIFFFSLYLRLVDGQFPSPLIGNWNILEFLKLLNFSI